jgi:hypothetical protein
MEKLEMADSTSLALDVSGLGELIDVKFSIGSNKYDTESVLEQANKLIDAYKKGETTPYGDH